MAYKDMAGPDRGFDAWQKMRRRGFAAHATFVVLVFGVGMGGFFGFLMASKEPGGFMEYFPLTFFIFGGFGFLFFAVLPWTVLAAKYRNYRISLGNVIVDPDSGTGAGVIAAVREASIPLKEIPAGNPQEIPQIPADGFLLLSYGAVGTKMREFVDQCRALQKPWLHIDIQMSSSEKAGADAVSWLKKGFDPSRPVDLYVLGDDVSANKQVAGAASKQILQSIIQGVNDRTQEV